MLEYNFIGFVDFVFVIFVNKIFFLKTSLVINAVNTTKYIRNFSALTFEREGVVEDHETM